MSATSADYFFGWFGPKNAWYGLVRQSPTYKSGLGFSVSPKGAKLANFTLNPNLARRRGTKIARLVGSEGMGVLVRQSSTYKSGLGIFISPKGAKLALEYPFWLPVPVLNF